MRRGRGCAYGLSAALTGVLALFVSCLTPATASPAARSPHPVRVDTLAASPTRPDLFSKTELRSPSGKLNEQDRAELADLRAHAHGRVTASLNANGKARFLRVDGGGDLLPSSKSPAEEKAGQFLAKYGALVGAPQEQLRFTETSVDDAGSSLTFDQQFGGLPVWGSGVRMNFSTDDRLTSINGFLLPDLADSPLSLVPQVDATTAASHAVAAVSADPPVDEQGVPAPVDKLAAEPAQLLIYPAGAVRGDEATPVLAWRIRVGDGARVAEEVLVSAATGKLLNRYSADPTALHRQLEDATQTLWTEGDAFPGSLNSARQNVLNATADSYWFFANAWNLDGPANDGATMKLHEDAAGQLLSCPNAAWTTSQLIYCPEMAADDVIAHEWAHGYTRHEAGLIYQWQPGALNEAYSDIWGETVDLINHRQDGDEGDISDPRPNACATASPAVPLVVIQAPAALARQCVAAGASFGAQVMDVTADIVPAVDADEDGEEPYQTQYDGCSTLQNPATIAGRIVLVDRGGCSATTKATRAQNAGAVGLIVVNTTNTVLPLTGTNAAITIPAVSIAAADGVEIRATAALEPVTVNLSKAPATQPTVYRWLLGEDTTPGPSRDLWRPSCYGDPGSVVDAEYYCDSTDNGGVHTNSTIASHAYALLVDGGSYGGVTVPGIGLDKAAAIYFRAESQYTTPLTGFPDHADALEAACTSLLGTAARVLSTSPNTHVNGATITATDCAAVSSAISAVALRSAPTRCGFGPMLAQTPGAPCGPGYAQRPVFTEDFTSGLGQWTTSDKIVYDQAFTRPWVRSGTAPDNHGPAAYAQSTNEGRCTQDSADLSSRNLLISPSMQFPAGALSPRLSFDHYVATETGYDGGNVKVRQSGTSTWLTVPAHAYLTNMPPQTLVGAPSNTNPLAGQPAFTGTDGGTSAGSWGTSVIDLMQAGIDPTQPFEFAFDFGRDGCSGVLGWYVDNVTVADCGARVDLVATQAPVPTAFGKTTRITVRAARNGTAGGAPTGSVQVRLGGRTYAATLSNGSALLDVPMTSSVGQLPVTVRYLPTGEFAPASVPLSLKVAKATAKLSAFIKPGTGRAGKPLVIIVHADAVGTSVRGAVRLFKGSRLLGKGKLSSTGRVRFKVRGLPARGKLKVTIKYAGSSTVAKAVRTQRIR